MSSSAASPAGAANAASVSASADKKASAASSSSGASAAAPAKPAVLTKEEAQRLEVRNYLEQTGVTPLLLKGMHELCKVRPEDPVKWLADYLVQHNPKAAAGQE